MRVFRITRKEFISDLSGRGAELFGGRWNHKGTPALYTSQSISLCLCETLVHLERQFFPNDLFYAELEIPDKLISAEFDGFDFDVNSQDLGTEWLKSKKALAMKVPSAIIPQERNVIINPRHSSIGRVKIVKTERFIIDERLLVE